MSEKHNYMKKLQEATSQQDVYRFMSVYVEAREARIDISDETTKMLAGMGEKAVEDVAKMLNDKSISEGFRGTAANCLMRAIGMQPEIGKSDVTKEELLKAVESTSTNEEDFISANAAEALISSGVNEINGLPTREYHRNLRDQGLQKDWNSLFGV